MVIVGAVVLFIVCGCAFGGYTVQADFSQPVSSSAAPAQAFVVHEGDNSTIIANNLEKQHLIRSAFFFKLMLKVNGLAFNPDPGTYQVAPSMSPTEIVSTLSVKQRATTVTIRVLEGSRLSEYPGQILASLTAQDLNNPKGATLANFSKSDFIAYTIKGKPFDDLAKKYWYVKPWGHGAYAALEGYLLPATYQVYSTATTLDIIEKMLDTFGEQLCPGDQTPTDYIYSQKLCKQHQATITMPTDSGKAGDTAVPGAGTKMGVFDALDTYYGANGTDYVGALQKALILGSLAQREARSPAHFALVASTYYNRWTEPTNPQTNGTLGGDPSTQYWLASQPNYTDPNPWKQLNDTPSNMANNPYNLYLTPGLPPSAIANPSKAALYGAIFPPHTNYLYFFFGCDNFNHYAADGNTISNEQGQFGVNQGPGSC